MAAAKESLKGTEPPPRCARLPGVRPLSRRTGILAALCAALTALLVAAPVALADNGEGLAGSVSDKTVTFFCFGVIAFFAILVIVLSLFQGRLEKRKERRRAAVGRLS
jgi:putative copper export protein